MRLTLSIIIALAAVSLAAADTLTLRSGEVVQGTYMAAMPVRFGST